MFNKRVSKDMKDLADKVEKLEEELAKSNITPIKVLDGYINKFKFIHDVKPTLFIVNLSDWYQMTPFFKKTELRSCTDKLTEISSVYSYRGILAYHSDNYIYPVKPQMDKIDL